MPDIRDTETEQPFVMISYAHKDAAHVLPVANELRARGIRVWTDENIAPHEVWDDVIALQVRKCELLLCFLSEAYLASDNCVEELKYAKGLDKPILGVYVEDVQLPPGLEMRLTTRQNVYMKRFPDTGSLVDHLCLCSEVNRCVEQPEQVPDEPETAPGPEPKQVEKRKTRKTRAGLSRGKFLLPLVILMSILGTILFFHLRVVKLDDDLRVEADASVLAISGKQINAGFMEKLAKLKDLKDLTFTDCSFDLMLSPTLYLDAELTSLKFENCTGMSILQLPSELAGLETLSVINSGVSSIHCISYGPADLKYLDLHGNPELQDLAFLSECDQLSSLDISGTAVNSLQIVPGDSLEFLDFSGTKVSNIERLSEWEKLSMVRGSNTPIKSIAPLAGLEGLVEITFEGCGLFSPTGEFLTLRLEKLDLSDNCIDKLDAFANCTILTEVDLSSNRLEDVSILKKSAATLTSLDLSDNLVKSESLKELLCSCDELTKLDLDRIPITELPSLAHMKKLSWLSASGCGLTSAPELGLHTESALKYLCLSNNDISSMVPIGNYGRINGMTLDLGGNQIGRIIYIPMGSYECLALADDTPDKSFSYLQGITGKTLVISGGAELTESIDAGAFEQIAILDCPMDERVRVEDHFGEDKVTFLENDDELIAYMDQLGLDYHFLEESAE